MNIYTSLIIVGSIAVGISTYLPLQIPNRYISFVVTVLSTIFSLVLTFAVTKRWLDKEYEGKMQSLREKYENKIHGMKKEHDTATLEKTIRDGTQTLIKNALDYFKLENIKNEMGDSAAIQNLQLDKYGQIIELLADFSLILPDIKENQEIVQQEINHQIAIYQIDERPFAMFLQRIMDKYIVTVNKKIREKVDQNTLGLMKTCPRCAERVMLKANVCKHCGYEFKTFSKTSAHNTIALDRLEKGKNLYRAGEYEEAVDALTSAIELKPNNANAYYNRAIVYYKLGDAQQAENDLKEASYLGHKKAQELLKLRKDGDKTKPPKYKL
jgi:tetratricopeptide (TPR) repeat protein